MNVSEFTHMLQNPGKMVTPVQTNQLDDILKTYPYFQAAHALRLKGLNNLNSFKYNDALKLTAAHTADRDILFDFITSEEFLQNTIADTISGRSVPIADREIIAEEVVAGGSIEAPLIEASEDEPLPRSVKDADAILDPALFKSKDPAIDQSLSEARKKAERDLEIGKPLSFTRDEKYSFSEWLQLTTLKTAPREEKKGKTKKSKKGKKKSSLKKGDPRKKKFRMVDRFIEENPRIESKRSASPKVDLTSSTKLKKEELMTETLARVYLEQKKYKKAIQAYKILRLKYPEKSSFFANRIKAVKELQRENN